MQHCTPLQNHLTEKLTLEDVAGSVSLTAGYCATLIKKETGTTVFEIIIKKRMILAQKYLLQKDGKSLQEVAKLCGYNDYSYFSKHFKRIFGYPPSKILL